MSVVTLSGNTLPLWVLLHGRLAPIASIVVFLSPVPTIQKIVTDRTVGNLPLLPYSTMIISAYLWFVYGVLKHEFAIYSSNGIGLLLGIYYFLSYQRYSPLSSSTLPGSLDQHVKYVSFVICTATMLPIVVPKSINVTEIIGKVGVLFCVGMFASPLAALRHVIISKSARSIPLPFTVASVINCWLWTIFGIYQTNDPNVYIPNILGLTFSLIQVALKLYYNDDKLSKRDETKMLQTDSAV